MLTASRYRLLPLMRDYARYARQCSAVGNERGMSWAVEQLRACADTLRSSRES